MHHAFSDTDRDPHSPKYKGFFTVYSNMWGYTVEIDRKFLKNLSNRPGLVFFYRHYFKILAGLAFVMLLVDPMFLIFGMAVPMVFAFHGYGLINAWTHRHGGATNSITANLLTAGEGYHKFHHDDGRNWRIGQRWYHFDTGAWFIKLIKHDE
jgi:stearoyl-CoA desaturase (delta-9 desaturase)